MRFVVLGAGAIGAVVGARLHQHGYDVVLIARAAHYEKISGQGLRVQSPAGEVVLQIPTVDAVDRLEFGEDDVVLLCVKSHDTAGALAALAAVAPRATAVACVQNGVANEPLALRYFPHVQSVSVACPTVFVEPGRVQAFSAPVTGLLDVGRYPAGADDLTERLAGVFNDSTFDSEIRTDITRWKHGKLLMNLGNAIEVVCGPKARSSAIGELALQEGVKCYEAAGIEWQTDKDSPRRELIEPGIIDGEKRPGGSSWQSATRRTGTIESSWLNGEIVLLGRLHGVPTPVNGMLTERSNAAARAKLPPGVMTPAEFVTEVGLDPAVVLAEGT